MIREATISDTARIAGIEVDSSRYAYRGIVPDECLYRDLSVEKRIPVYRGWITEKRFSLYVYEEDGTGTVKAMMGIGACEDDDRKGAFELHFLYVDPEDVRKGIGSEMLRFFEEKGRENGCTEYVIWVLEENESGRRFYEKHSYRPDGKEKIFKRWNKREIRYVRSGTAPGEKPLDFYDAVRARRSVRDFTDERIPEATLRRILEAAYCAPANDHFRDWHFVVVTDPDVKRNVLAGVPQNLTVKDVDGMTFISDPVQKESYQVAVPKQYRMLSETAALIVPLMRKKADILHPADLSDLNVYASVWCSIENLWLAATAEGYGCNLRIPRGDEEAVAQKALGFPDGYLIPCFIGIGRPAPDAVLTRQIEPDLDRLIHWQKF